MMKKLSFLTFILLLICSDSNFAQKFNWLKTYTPSNNNLSQFVEVYGNNVIVAGEFQGSINFGTTVLTNQNNATSIFIANYDTSGVFQWAIKGGADQSSEEIQGLEIDENGNIYVIGSFSFGPTTWGNLSLNIQGSSSSTFKTESFIVKLNPTGLPLWIRGFFNPTTSLSRTTLQQISIADGSLYILGKYIRNISVTGSSLTLSQASQPIIENVFISKFDLNGNLFQLDRIISNSGTAISTITDLEAIDSNSYYLSGSFGANFSFGSNTISFSNPTSSFAFVIAKYTGSNCDWLNNSTSNNSFFGGFNVRLEISETNDLWFAGANGNNFNFFGQTFQLATFGQPEWFYGKLSSAGSLLDIRSFTANSVDLQDIVENNAGELLLAGSFNDSISLKGQQTISKGISDQLIVSIGSNYSINWYQTGGGAGNDFSFGIASVNSDNAYVLSNFQGLSQFGSTFLTAPVNRNASLLFKIGECQNNQTPISFIGDTNLCQGQSVRIVAAPLSPSTFRWLKDSIELAGEVFRDLTVFNSGNYQVIVNGDGCSDTSRVIPVRVDTLPIVNLALIDTICRSDTPVVLSGGSPLGGIYSGRGIVSDSIFDPSVAGIGNTSISYVVSNGGCSDSSTAIIYVNPAPTLFFSPLSDICINASPIILGNAFPLGGTFSGIGVNGNQFDPSISNGGQIPITYTYSDLNGCTSSISQIIEVDTLENSSFSTIPDICITDGVYNLSEGSPAGGRYEGIGVNGSNFDPLISGAGTFTLSYIISNECGDDTSFQSITVNPAPMVSLPDFTDLCANDAPITLNSGSPAGGIYSGTGVSNAIFDPSISGSGTFTIFYDYTNAIGCSSRDSNTITVNALPVAAVSNDTAICFGDQVTLSASGGATYLWSDNSTTASILVSPISTTKYFVTISSISNCSIIDSIEVTVNPLPTVSITGDSTICEGSSGTLTANGGINYLWNTTETTNSIIVNPNSNTTYTVTVIDSNSCLDTASQLITVNPAPAVSLPVFSDLCANDVPITLNSGSPAGGIYSGTGVSNSIFDPSISGAGIFTIFYDYTNPIGCSSQDSSTITVNALPVAAISNDTAICFGDQVTLSASGGTTYLWSDNSNSSSISVSPISTTKYFVTISSISNCSIIDSIEVTVNPLPTVSITGDSTICEGSSGTLTANGGINYLWNTTETTNSIIVNPNSNTTYIVTVTDSNSCSDTASQLITVNPAPTVSLPVFSDLCANDVPITLNSGSPVGGIYSGNGVSNSIFDPSITGSGTFTIFYDYTNAIGCSSRDSNTITVNALPVTAVSNDTAICFGDQVTLSASGGATYLWSDNSTTASISVSPISTTKYYVSISSSSNCSIIDSIEVSVNPLPTIITSNDTSICLGDSISLSASSSASNFLWSTTETSSIISVKPIANTDFTILVRDSLGCTNSDSIRVTVNTATPILLGNDTTITVSQSVTYDAGPGFSSYLWQDGSSNQTLTIGYDPLKSGLTDTIIVLAFNSIGCSSTDSALLSYDMSTLLDKANTLKNDINIYPNPSNGVITLESQNLIDIELIRVYNQKGKLLKEETYNQKIQLMNLNLLGLSSGVYFIEINALSGRLIKKIIIE